MMRTGIVFVGYGLANKIGESIYINKALAKHPNLFQKIMNHEIKHATGQKNVDVNEPFDWELFKFTLKHPSAWLQFLPIWVIKNKIIYSKTMIYLWLFIIAWIIFLVAVASWMI